MAEQSQATRKTTHARIYRDLKKRVRRIAATRAMNEDDTITDIAVMTEILERELPKEEKKLGIKN